MPQYPGILDRFRRFLSPPGRPAETLGVPASGSDLEAELAALLARLEAIDAQAARIEDDARAEAARRLERAERERAAILEQARSSADAERVRAATEQRERMRASAHQLREQARREADRIRARREEAVGELVEQVMECVRRSAR